MATTQSTRESQYEAAPPVTLTAAFAKKFFSIRLWDIIRWLGYLFLVIVFLTPFIWTVLASFRQESEILANLFPLTINTFLPRSGEWTLEHYQTVMGLNEVGAREGLQFQKSLWNSFVVSAAVVVASLIFNTLAAFFFSRLPFPKKNVILLYVIATLFVPIQVTLVPLFIVVKQLGFGNTYWAMILPWFASPFVIFALIQFFREIPIDLDEAAIVDGANYVQILRHVIMPLSIPGLITMSLLEFQFIWNLFLWPLIAVSDKNIQVIQVTLALTQTQRTTYWGRRFAGAAMASVPVIILFVMLQKYYTEGVAQTGVKG
ncbi:MAG: carbohydrate ABC transporter permease [Anaerolineales bacterium]|nr:carbohydrate ABC transporter permease [Anaerolineales bacterium]MCB0010288.1 carbohydrate ABC transporter permease [Anaerolineales bacterium]MCB0031892.1 carbohydrate ABC transporter permease [Anaerolineales bacterium]